MSDKKQLRAIANGSGEQAIEYVIQTNQLAKTYRGVTALQSLNLRIPKHAICGFLGPNGAGKSTALKLLLGLARPTGGSGTIFGHDIERESLAIRRRVGYLAQEPRFYEYMTARETLRFTARFFYTGPATALEERVTEMLELVGLSEKANRPVKSFSGGERQRLGIAQAQINSPDLLLLDEPAASLDPLGRRDVLEIMQRLRKLTTILYSTHLLDDVQRVSDMVVILKDGAQIVQAPIETLLTGSSNGQVVYVLTLQGNTQPAFARITSQPWVSHVDVSTTALGVTWQITVNDEQAAQAQLLSLVTSDGQASVLNFGRKKQELEDAFVTLMERNAHGF
ncbi:MAG: ABC transporter ATP-binding protein [Ktedonobacteraceae bacterium]|nr:ABC transporter ATP-binding protein [Ktedonobacteraceae bacterium]